MRIYKLLSAVLCYPEQELVDAVPELCAVLSDQPHFLSLLTPLLDELGQTDLIHLQQDYVQTFDRTASHSLHLFEHIHGEDRARGQAMVDLCNIHRTRLYLLV